jgi:trehalose-phosphatase
LTLGDILLDAEGWLAYQNLRGCAEFKTGSIAVHWRGLSRAAVEEVGVRALLGWRSIAERGGLELLEFDGGIEIRVPRAHKGDVVRFLVEEEGDGVPSAYLGDDNTDETAFRAIRDRGLGILVRPRCRPSAAQAWLKPPDEVLDFLQRWSSSCSRNTVQANTSAEPCAPNQS